MLRVSWPEYFEWCLSEDKVVEKLLKKIKIKTNIIGGIIVSSSFFYFLQNLMIKIHASKHELKSFWEGNCRTIGLNISSPLIKPDLLEILQQDPNPLTPTTSITP